MVSSFLFRSVWSAHCESVQIPPRASTDRIQHLGAPAKRGDLFPWHSCDNRTASIAPHALLTIPFINSLGARLAKTICEEPSEKSRSRRPCVGAPLLDCRCHIMMFFSLVVRRGKAMDFIEQIFGISPDGGSGSFELLLFVIPVV